MRAIDGLFWVDPIVFGCLVGCMATGSVVLWGGDVNVTGSLAIRLLMY